MTTEITIQDCHGRVLPSLKWHSELAFEADLVTLARGLLRKDCHFAIVDPVSKNPIPFKPGQAAYYVVEQQEAFTPRPISRTREEPEVMWVGAANNAFFHSQFSLVGEYSVSPKDVVDYLRSSSNGVSAASVGALTQSSGWGKSRLMREICETHRMPYISFAAAGAVPGATAFVTKLFAPVFGVVPKQQQPRTADELTEEAQICLASLLFDTCDNAAALSGKDFFMSFFNPEWVSRRTFEKSAAAALKDAIDRYCATFGVEYVLLLIDEAAWLLDEAMVSSDGLTPFRVMRRALKLVNITALFASTNSAVQNFLPALHKENAGSWKAGSITPSDLAEGICNVGPIDASVKVPDAGIKMREVYDVLRLAAYGRPLWLALVSASINQGTMPSLESMILYARKKMAMEDEESGHMACCLALTGISGLTPGRLSEDLIKSHMATLRGISSDRTTVHTTYITEPFIHLAALRVLFNSTKRFRKVMSTFQSAMTEGMVNIGYSGEIAARLILLIPRARGTPSVMRLDDFVQLLTGKRLSVSPFEYVSFTHWIGWDGQISRHLLYDAFLRTAAIATGRNEKAVDLIIPVALIKADGIVQEKQMKAVFIQIKNRKTHCGPERVFRAMSAHLPKYKRNSYFWIIQRTGLSTPKQQDIKRFDTTFSSLVPEEQPTVRETLIKLLEVHLDAPAVSNPPKFTELSSEWLTRTISGCYTSKKVDDDMIEESSGSEDSAEVANEGKKRLRCLSDEYLHANRTD